MLLGKYDISYLSYDLLGSNTLPFKAHPALTADDIGKVVTITGDYEVGIGATGSFPLGKLIYLEKDGTCTVELGNRVLNLPGVPGSLPDEGDFVYCNGSGYVIEAPSAIVNSRKVIGVDASTCTVTVLT